MRHGRWSTYEHDAFLIAFELYGKRGIREITRFVGTRTRDQVRSHIQKYEISRNKGKKMYKSENYTLSVVVDLLIAALLVQ